MDGVVKVVRPDGVQADAAFRGRQDDAPIVVVRLRDDVHRSLEQPGFLAGRLGQLGQDVDRALIEDRVDGVQPEAVDVELADPVPGVLDEVTPHARAVGPVEVDRGAPGRLVAVGEVRAVLAQVVALGAEVVVDHVEHDAQAQARGPRRPGAGGRAAHRMWTAVHTGGRRRSPSCASPETRRPASARSR